MHTTNYYNTLITVAADCPVARGTPPSRPDTIGGLQYALITQQPYGYTSDELLVEVQRRRKP